MRLQSNSNPEAGNLQSEGGARLDANKAKATIDGVLSVEALLNGGSDICLLPRRTYSQLKPSRYRR